MESPDIEKLVVIGCSMGGLSALKRLFSEVVPSPKLTFIVAQHLAEGSKSALPDIISRVTSIECRQPENDEKIEAGKIYCAPGGLHTLVQNGKFKLGKGERVNGARPSIDHLFLSAALEYKERVIGLLLTGLLSDGTRGLQYIKEYGGTLIIQDPKDAEYSDIPANALKKNDPDFILPLKKIGSTIDLLLGQVKIKSELKARVEDLEKLKASLKRREDPTMAQLPVFSHTDSLLAIIQLMQERSNMLEQMTEQFLIEDKKSMASLYFQRLKEVNAHAANLQDILRQYALAQTG